MSAPNDQEVFLIAQLRERVWNFLVTEEQSSDAYLLRWIRAKGHDLDKAEELLRKSLIWRVEHGLDQNNGSLPLPDPWYFENVPYDLSTVDKYGRPVAICPLAHWNIPQRPSGPEGDRRLECHWMCHYEALMEFMRIANRNNPHNPWPITQATYIIDWKDFPFSQLLHWNGFHVPMKAGQMYEAHYPETAARVFHINCPPAIPLFFAMIKRVMRPKSLEKFVFLRGEEEWKPVLREEIGEEQLPIRYGGKKEMIQLEISIGKH